MTINKYGLSRTIPSDVKRQLRQESGFGCVICGIGIINYEHIDPEFAEAKIHDPQKMTILCPTCHTKVTTGKISKAMVKRAKDDPICLKQGFSNDWFEFTSEDPFINFAGSRYHGVQNILELNNVIVLKICAPTEEKQPFLISGEFFDDQGDSIFRIENNEWYASSENWDVEFVGKVLIIRSGAGQIALKITINPPYEFTIDRLETFINGKKIIGDSETLSIGALQFSNCSFSGSAKAAIKLNI